MRSKQLLKILKQEGWWVDRIKGSHYVLKKEGRTVILPMHNKEMPKGLADKIMKDAGLK